MSDARLREFERRWRDTQSAEDEAAYLTERLRAGELTATQLWAYCGRPGAVLVMPHAATTVSPTVPLRWVHGLERWGRRPCAAAALATLPLVWPLLREGVPWLASPNDHRPWSRLRLAQFAAVRELAEEWLHRPTETTASRLAEHRWLARGLEPSPNLPLPVWRRQSACTVLLRALDTIVEESFATSAANCLNTANDFVPVDDLARAAREAVLSLAL